MGTTTTTNVFYGHYGNYYTKDTLRNVSVCRVSMLLLMEVHGLGNHMQPLLMSFMGTTTNGGGLWKSYKPFSLVVYSSHKPHISIVVPTSHLRIGAVSNIACPV